MGRARRGVRDCRAHKDEEEEVREMWGKREREREYMCIYTLMKTAVITTRWRAGNSRQRLIGT